MPKELVDYSNTIIYKIFCKDKNVKDVYFGSTTNFRQKKYLHKTSCNNNKTNNYFYSIIRENGGWDNWDMIEIEHCKCKNAKEAKLKEEFYKNMVTINDKNYSDKNLHEITSGKKNKLTKNTKNKNVLYIGVNNNDDDNSSYINIIPNQSQNCDMVRVTDGLHMVTKMVTNGLQKNEKCLKIVCECGRKYNYRQGLWRHQKNCVLIYNKEHITTPNIYPESQIKNNNETNEIKILTELVLDVVKQNQELTNKIVNICNTGTQVNNISNTISNSIINSNNKTFNLHVFLNETCKNAMNISDFINSLQLKMSDLEDVGKLGYVDGISNIIVKNLNALDETTRPIHCTDKKRETFYIKDENKWEKDDEKKNKIKKIIKNIANKNEKLLPKFKELHPGCNYSDSKYSDQYSKLVIEAMGGLGNNDNEKEDKIIKNIAKEVTISKQNKLC